MKSRIKQKTEPLMFEPCLTTANPSFTADGFKMMSNSIPAWLRASLTGCCFKVLHSCTNR